MNKKEIKHFDMKGIPKNWAMAIKRVYSSYPKECLPQGVCDMAYIVNVISHELGLSDGKGNYKKFEVLK